MKQEILRMQDVCVGESPPYGLDGFHLFLRRGEFLNIVGLSGAGKTLLYEFFMGHVQLKAGRVVCNGRTFGPGERFSGMTDVTCIGQESTLIPGLTVAENIFIITGNRKVKGLVWMPHIDYRARILLGQYAPDISPHDRIFELSAVERRIVELLRAIENEAKLVVIDDAFGGFGQSDIRRLLDLLHVMKEKGIAVIYESHELNFANREADRIVVMQKGRYVRTFYDVDFDEEMLKKLLTGNETPPVFERENVSGEEIVLEFCNISGTRYIRHVSLSVHEGEILGIYDLNNRRNLELLKLLTGEEEIQEGSVYLNGSRYEPRDLEYAISKGIGYFSGNGNGEELVTGMDFAENICLPLLKRTSRFGIFRKRGLLRFLKQEYRKELGIPKEDADAEAGGFDAYIQTGILLKRWALFGPKVMVCAEPFSNADLIMRDIMFRAFREMAKNRSAVLIASQDMNELKHICDTIYVLNSDAESEICRYEIREKEG